jgi:hypothetical protein
VPREVVAEQDRGRSRATLWSLAKFCALLTVAGAILMIVAFSLFLKIATLDTRSSPTLFRQCVIDPVPKSVTGIRVDHPDTTNYVFRFAVNEADFGIIRKSRPFRESENLMCLGGISWDWKDWKSDTHESPGGQIVIYPAVRGVRVPAWFDLPSWRNPEVWGLEHISEKSWDDQILVYNRQLGQAYFIAHHYEFGGTMW